VCVALARGLWCRSGGPGRTGCRAADRVVLRQGGQLAKGYIVGVMNGRRGRGSEGGMGEDAVGMAVEAPTAAAAPLASAPSAAIGLLLKMTLITMDKGARVALNLRRKNRCAVRLWRRGRTQVGSRRAAGGGVYRRAARDLGLSQARRRLDGGPTRSEADGSGSRACPWTSGGTRNLKTDAGHGTYIHVPREAETRHVSSLKSAS